MRETNDASAASPPASERSGSDSDLSTASESTARDRSESEPDEQAQATLLRNGSRRSRIDLFKFGYDSDGASIDFFV